MTDLATVRGSLEQCYDAIEGLIASADQRPVARPVAVPGLGRCAASSTHLGMMEQVMTGWLPGSAEDVPPLDRIGPYQEQVAGLDDGRFAALIRRIFAARRADLAGLTADDLDQAIVDADRQEDLRRVPGDPDLRLLGARA